MFKPFFKQLYAENDQRGKDAVAAWLTARGCRVESFFQYDVDLIVKKGTSWICFVEVEVRGWNECKFDTIHIAERKKKLLVNSMPTYVFVWGNSLEFAYFSESKDILSSPLVEVKNKLVADNEKFYDVPIKKFTKIKLSVIK